MNKHKTKKYYGFTLVELIIVITIIAILSTIAFVSFSMINQNARDSKRISDIQAIYKWMQLSQIKTWIYPKPNGSLFIDKHWYQWYFIEDIKSLWNVFWELYDPLDWSKYIYLTNLWDNKLQLWAYLEKNDIFNLAFVNKTYASNLDFNDRYLYVYGDNIWIFLDPETNMPLNEFLTWTLNVESYSWTIKTYYNNEITLTGSWSKLLDEIVELNNSMSWSTNSWTTNTWSTSFSCSLWSWFILWTCKL